MRSLRYLNGRTLSPFPAGATEIADSAIAIYGIGRLGQTGIKLALDLRAASRACREQAVTLTEISQTDLQKINTIDDNTAALVDDLQKAEAAEAGNAVAPGPTDI